VREKMTRMGKRRMVKTTMRKILSVFVEIFPFSFSEVIIQESMYHKTDGKMIFDKTGKTYYHRRND